MPEGKAIKSDKQYGLMQAAAHGNSTRAKAMGLSPEVASKLIDETSPSRRHKFAKQMALGRKHKG